MKNSSIRAKNNTPCLFILRPGWYIKGRNSDFFHLNQNNNLQSSLSIIGRRIYEFENPEVEVDFYPNESA